MNRYRTFLFLLNLIFFTFVHAIEYPPGGGGGGEQWVQFNYEVAVTDQDNNPMPNFNVVMIGMYDLWEGNQSVPYTVFEYGQTDQNGYVALRIWVEVTGYYPENYNFYRISVDINEPLYSILSSEDAISYFPTGAGSLIVVHDEDDNGILDENERPLAEKFCPTLILNHSTEYCYPEPVEYYGVDKDDLWIYIRDINTEIFDVPNSSQADFNPALASIYPWVNSPDNYAFLTFNPFWEYTGSPPGKSFHRYFLWFHYNYAGSLNDPNGWHNFYNTERQNNNYPHTSYVHLFKEDGYVVLQYWFFYPFNDYTNNHEGDWEHINVMITSQDPINSEIHRVDFYFHERVRIVYPYEPNSLLHFDSDNHPKIYVGGTRDGALGEGNLNGGSYPAPGIWENINAGNPAEIVAGNGPVVSYYGSPNQPRFENLVILPDVDDINYIQHPEMSWFKAQIPWGILGATSPGDWLPRTNVGNDAPCGPAYNDAWDAVGTVGVYSLYTANPQPLPVGPPPAR